MYAGNPTRGVFECVFDSAGAIVDFFGAVERDTQLIQTDIHELLSVLLEQHCICSQDTFEALFLDVTHEFKPVVVQEYFAAAHGYARPMGRYFIDYPF